VASSFEYGPWPTIDTATGLSLSQMPEGLHEDVESFLLETRPTNKKTHAAPLAPNCFQKSGSLRPGVKDGVSSPRGRILISAASRPRSIQL